MINRSMVQYCLIVCLVMTLIFTSCTNSIQNTSENDAIANLFGTSNKTDALNTRIKNGEKFTLVSENNKLELYVSGVTSEVKIRNKTTGKEWYTNPVNRSEDKTAMGDNAYKLNSQFFLTYVDSKMKSSNYFSKTDSVDYNQFDFKEISNGIRVNYTVGKQSQIFVLPLIISKQRMENFLSKLSEEDQAELLNCYALYTLKEATDETTKKLLIQRFPSISKNDIYVFSSVRDGGALNVAMINMPYMLGSMIEELLNQAGYTQQDFITDYKENSLTLPLPTTPVFKVSIEYILDDDSLIVRFPYKDIQYDSSKYWLTNISVMPFFGAADTTKNGYIFVPDGSGAIINLNNGKTGYQPYIKGLYGEDKSIYTEKLKQSDNTQACLPVYGLKENDDAFLAIIEKGDSEASINAYVSNMISRYNNVYPSFNLTPNNTQSQAALNLAGMQKFQEKPMQSDIQIRYMFLNGDSDYTSMALRYQQYLLDNKLIKTQDFQKELPFNVNLLGALKYNTSILGFPVRAMKVLTSYSQTQKIIEQLKKQGVLNITLQYTGWCNGGITNTGSKSVDLIGALGGKGEFESLLEYLNKNKISFYPDVNFVYISENSIFNDFDVNSQAARELSNGIAYDYDYQLDLLTINKTAKKRYIVSPSIYDSYISSFLNIYSKYDLTGISLATLGKELVSDYHKGSQIDRQKAENLVVSALDSVTKSVDKIAVNGANGYTLKNATNIFKMQLDSGRSYIIDNSIPFYQIAMHGILPYSGEALNMAADFDFEVLKSIETGAAPFFEWIYGDNLTLKETNYNYYSIGYSLWLKDAVNAYEKINSAIGDCQSAKIIVHKAISEGVYQTVYSNGKTIYTNYNNTDVEIDGKTVQARNYLVSKVGVK